MADKTVGELPRAATVTTTDLFVLEQAGQAKALTGQILVNDLATALDGHGGIKSIVLNADYTLTFTMADDTEVTTTSVRGATGAKGDKGTDGRAINSVTKTGTSGLADTYTIAFSDDTTSTFTVSNGASIKSIAKTGTSGLVDTYTVTTTDNDTSTFTVTNGNGIASIALQSGNHAAGTTDTYKITFDNGEFTTFSVYNGLNGSGSVVSINGVSPNASGDVSITGADVPVGESDDTTVSEAIADRQPQTNDLTGEATLADGDYFPFYDVSATANRKTPWSNIVSKIRSALFGTTNGFLKANGSGVVSAASTIGTDDIAQGAVTGQKIADDTITMAHLSADVKYTKTYWRSTPSELLAEWHCGIVYPDSASVYFAITPNIAASLPVGYRCRIVSYLQTELRWGDFGDSSIEIISSGEGKAYYSRYGTITIPQNRYVDIERTGNSIWLLSGSYADHMISSGTAAPSGGNDGDVYIQYS